jgi:hypothetical protein
VPPPPDATAPRSSLEGVKLAFEPSDEVTALAQLASRTLAGRKVVVRPFEDARPPAQRKLVGRHPFIGGDSLVTTRDDVGVFCTAQLVAILKRAGVAVVPEGGDLTISSTIERFMVEEVEEERANTPIRGTAQVAKHISPWTGAMGMPHNPYIGTVVLEVSVEDAANKVQWRGVALGASTNWGTTFTLGNHRQTMSDALAAAYGDLFEALAPVPGAPAK